MRYSLLLIIWLLPIVSLTAQSNGFPNFKAADSVASLYEGESLHNLPVLAYNLTGPFSEDVDKLRAIYTWVSTNIKNDYAFYAINKRKREKYKDDPERLKEWNDQFTSEVFSTLLKDNKTVCTGYAYLIKELCYHAGIEAEIIDGYGRTAEANIGGEGIVNHSWNAVKLNGKWYLCDATWSSGGVNSQEKKFVKSYNDGYFLADPKLFALNHYPIDTLWLLLKEKPALWHFLNGPLVYRGAFKHKVLPVSPQHFNITVEKGENLPIVFEKMDYNEVGEVKLEIITGNMVLDESVIPKPLSNNQYQVNYSFKARGKYAVHVRINEDYVMSYEAEVVK